MKQLQKNSSSILIILLFSFIIIGCANPFGEGTWRPLPFKKWQKKDTTKSVSSAVLFSSNQILF